MSAVAMMLCNTAGLDKGQMLTVTSQDEPFVFVTDWTGVEHVLMSGDVRVTETEGEIE